MTSQPCAPVVNDLPPDISDSTLRAMLVTMLRIRGFEERVADLVSQGEIKCPVHLYTGQEAVAAGVCASLRRSDFVFSNHRSHGHYIAKGGDVKTLMAELYGRFTGCCSGKGGSMHLASPEMGLPGSSAIVAGTVPLAVGAAMAIAIQNKKSVSVSFFGDGAVNEGAWYESLNFASLKKLPVIFVCENNLYSTHMPIGACLANTDIHKVAAALCVPSVRINGNDVVEVYSAARKAIEAARHGGGPAFVECMTYRWRGHVGPNYDVDKGLRTQEEVDAWMTRCPISSFESTLIKKGIVSVSQVARLSKKVDREIEEALVFAKGSPYPQEDQAFCGVFKEAGR